MAKFHRRNGKEHLHAAGITIDQLGHSEYDFGTFYPSQDLYPLLVGRVHCHKRPANKSLALCTTIPGATTKQRCCLYLTASIHGNKSRSMDQTSLVRLGHFWFNKRFRFL
jgi:hypothetical protein